MLKNLKSKKSGLLLLLFVLLCGAAGEGHTDQKTRIMLYSSLKDVQLAALKFGFTKKYPDIVFKYYSDGSGNILEKLISEQGERNIKADLLWIGEPTYYCILKEKGLLMPYLSPEAKSIPKELIDKDHYYCGARIVTLGFVYNTQKVKPKDIPKNWEDLLEPKFKGRLAMTDPRYSGTAFYTVAALYQNSKFGWNYFRNLKKNGLKLEENAVEIVEKVSAGEYDVCIGVDYIAKTIMEKGAPLGFAYARNGISTVVSPIAILKSTQNYQAVKKLYDYILSIEGQLILMKENVIPVRPEVKLAGAISIKDAVRKALPVNEERLVLEKDKILNQFTEIMQD
jgi:iron(III) transport system substrate-binding protein